MAGLSKSSGATHTQAGLGISRHTIFRKPFFEHSTLPAANHPESMKVTVEISLYPLHDQSESSVLAFLEKLKKYPNIVVETNGLSTQIFGDYDFIMKELLPVRIQEIFENERAVVIMKLAQGHLRYEE